MPPTITISYQTHKTLTYNFSTKDGVTIIPCSNRDSSAIITKKIDLSALKFQGFEHLEINTGIAFNDGSGKSLKLHVTQLPDNNYTYYLGNLQRLSPKEIPLSKRNTTYEEVTEITINGSLVELMQGQGAFNTLYMTPIGSTLKALNNQYVYSRRTFKYQKHDNETVQMGILSKKLTTYLTQNPHFQPYAEKLAIPQNVKVKFSGKMPESPVTVHDIMLNGAGGNFYNNKIITFSKIKSLVESLYLLWASGHRHNDIKPENIIQTASHGLALIDFGFSYQQKKAIKNLPVSGTSSFFSPRKRSYTLIKDNENLASYNSIENDLYGLCLSFLEPYLPPINNTTNLPIEIFNSLIKHAKGVSSTRHEISKKITSEYPDNNEVSAVLLAMFDIYKDLWSKYFNAFNAFDAKDTDKYLTNTDTIDLTKYITALATTLEIDATLRDAVNAQHETTSNNNKPSSTIAPCQPASTTINTVNAVNADNADSIKEPTAITAHLLAKFSTETPEQTQAKQLADAIKKGLDAYKEVRFINGFWTTLYSIKSFFWCGKYSAKDKKNAVTAVENAIKNASYQSVPNNPSEDDRLCGALKNQQLKKHLANACRTWQAQQETTSSIPAGSVLEPLYSFVNDKTKDDTEVVDALIDFLKLKHTNPGIAA